MPVAVSRNNPSTSGQATVTDNGFITREFPPTTRTEMEYEDDFSNEDFDSDDSDEDDDDLEEDYSEAEENQTLLSANNVSSNGPTTTAGLFEEYFDYEPSVVNRERRCNHQVTSRPCHYCAPSVSMRLANEVRIAFKALFNSKILKFDYVPLDRSISDGQFKSLKALHDLDYIKKVLNEIIHLIACIQNVPNYKINYAFNSALLRIHDRTESLLDDIRGTGKYQEYQVVLDFRKKLNAIGFIYGSFKENGSSTCNMYMECQR